MTMNCLSLLLPGLSSASYKCPIILQTVPRLFQSAASDGSRLRPSRYRVLAFCASPAASASSASSIRLSGEAGFIVNACSRCCRPKLVSPISINALPSACRAAGWRGCSLTRVRICRAPPPISPICRRHNPARYKTSGFFGSCF